MYPTPLLVVEGGELNKGHCQNRFRSGTKGLYSSKSSELIHEVICLKEQKGSLEEELKSFTGTTKYYRHGLGLLYTEGIQYLAENAGCYWLIDVIASYQPELQETPFQLWELEVNEDQSAGVTMKEDQGLPNLVRQEIPFTDFPLKQIKLHCYNNVLLLPSEY